MRESRTSESRSYGLSPRSKGPIPSDNVPKPAGPKLKSNAKSAPNVTPVIFDRAEAQYLYLIGLFNKIANTNPTRLQLSYLPDYFIKQLEDKNLISSDTRNGIKYYKVTKEYEELIGRVK